MKAELRQTTIPVQIDASCTYDEFDTKVDGVIGALLARINEGAEEGAEENDALLISEIERDQIKRIAWQSVGYEMDRLRSENDRASRRSNHTKITVLVKLKNNMNITIPVKMCV